MEVSEKTYLREWVKTQHENRTNSPGFFLFLKKIEERRESLIRAAIAPGDTEGIKNEIRGMKWVLDQSENLKRTDTDSETALEESGTDTEDETAQDRK